jgi:5-oxoprolinase (ATP-hydrolysing)
VISMQRLPGSSLGERPGARTLTSAGFILTVDWTGLRIMFPSVPSMPQAPSHKHRSNVSMQVPAGSLLSPAEDAAVVGGNVLTSQRVTDVVLKAFKAMACSYGCMNNFTFGDAGMGYYETIAGGGGAGPGFAGCSGVQMHMTNTRITDPEVLERYYPVSLRRFSLRRDSGGAGRWPGGCGVVRELEFLRPVQIGVLSERRSLAPEGLLGGADGLRGENLLIRANGQVINLGGKASVQVQAGDRCELA